MRLRRKLEAREEVIRQLNRQLHDAPPGAMPPEAEESPSVVEEYVYRARVLDAEVAGLREQLAGGQLEIASLQSELAAISLKGGQQGSRRRGALWKTAAKVKRRLRR